MDPRSENPYAPSMVDEAPSAAQAIGESGVPRSRRGVGEELLFAVTSTFCALLALRYVTPLLPDVHHWYDFPWGTLAFVVWASVLAAHSVHLLAVRLLEGQVSDRRVERFVPGLVALAVGVVMAAVLATGRVDFPDQIAVVIAAVLLAELGLGAYFQPVEGSR